MAEKSELYERLKARRTSLKGSVTRKLRRLSEFSKHELLNKTAFEQCDTSLQLTLNDLRSTLKLMSELTFELPKEIYEEIKIDVEKNEEALENFEVQAVDLKCEFDIALSKRNNLFPNTKEINKPKFKPKDLAPPKWNGNLITYNAWKKQIKDYFKITNLTTDPEQLVVLLYQNVLPNSIQFNLRDCTNVNQENGVWERLDAKFPINSIPRAILQALKETKPMSSASAREMRRVLEQIKDFARHSKLADRTEELASQTTLDLIEQKLSNNLVRSFRRWVNKEHKDKPVTVDLLIVLLQDETELEERLQIKTPITYEKTKNATVNQLRTDSREFCKLCKQSYHRFVDCAVFLNYTPQQRTEPMRKLGRCFTCLTPKHRISQDCRYRRRCALCNCSHHSMLACVQRNAPLNQIKTVNVPSTSTLNASADEYQPRASNIQTVSRSENNIKYSPSVLIELLDGNGMWRKAVALLDSGSDVTLIKRDTVQNFHLTSKRKPFMFKFGTAGGGSCSENSATISLWIRRQNQPSSRFNITAIELEKPAHNIPKFSEQLFEEYAYLKSIESFVPKRETSVVIVIGFDYANLFKASSYLHQPLDPENNPTGVDTPLGWYIYGPKNQNALDTDELSCVHRVYVEQNAEYFQSLYESDVCGVKPTRICACTDKEVVESQFLKHVKNTIRQTKEGRIEVSVPWKEGFPDCLQFNRDKALIKLTSLEKRLNKLGLMKCYSEEMKLILDEYAEPVSPDDISKKRGWYINHFPIIRPGKSTSCRIVWNSAAVYKGLSLNDGLFKGPNLLNSLFCVLLAWRCSIKFR